MPRSSFGGPRTNRRSSAAPKASLSGRHYYATLRAWLADNASVFITHAGMGGTVESLWFGVPTVAIPQAVDQFTNAARLEAIGAGVQLPTEQLDGASLRAAVDAAAGRTGRVQALRADVRSSGGAAIAADTVERLCG